MQGTGLWETFSSETISVTLKFGFLQSPSTFPIADAPNSILDRLYNRAEKWLRDIASAHRNPPIVGRYAIYLYRIPATEFGLIPIRQASDVEQNCVIEIVLTPVETSQHTHSLIRCQLNMPTNCSRCTGFIVGLYKQGFRCKKCRLTFHKDCVPLLADDCPVPTIDEGTSAGTTRPKESLTFIYPFVGDVPPPKQPLLVDSTGSDRTESGDIEIGMLKIIERGIFPVCTRGSQFSRRFLFRLTTHYLSITSDISATSVAQLDLRQSHITRANDGETILSLTDIVSLVLTHLEIDHDDVFEIHLQKKIVLSVGKKTDSEELQMQTAQFYSAIRDQWESLINSAPTSASASATPTNSGPTGTTKSKTDKLPALKSVPSICRISPQGKDNDQLDLHELYSFTGVKIGEGAFGRVVSAYNKITKQEVAVKIIEKLNCDPMEMQRINGEAQNLYKFNHMNILKLEAYYERKDAVYLVTERLETDLCKYILKQPAGRLDEDLARTIAYQLIVAVRYLHNNNCGHLDIKCENILISLLDPIPGRTGDPATQECPLVKLADFGYSRIIREDSFRKTRVGTKVYSAPEIYRGAPGYNRQADMWSVGVVLYAVLSGTLPYDEKGFHRAEEVVRNPEQLFGSQQWRGVSREAKDLIGNKLLVIQTTSRLNANGALFELWFSEYKLYGHLREIERRAREFVKNRKEVFPSASNWLTQARQDELWLAYEEMYIQSRNTTETSSLPQKTPSPSKKE